MHRKGRAVLQTARDAHRHVGRTAESSPSTLFPPSLFKLQPQQLSSSGMLASLSPPITSFNVASSSKSLRSLAVTPKASRSALACLRQSGSSVAQRLNGMAIYGLLCFTPSLLRPSWSMAASFRAPAGTSLYTPPSLARPRRVRVPPSSSIRGRGRRHASADSHVAPPPRTPRRVTMTYDRTWGRVHRTRDQRADCTTRAPPLVACRGGIASLAAARVP
ncbi:hypothetical protein BHM03_00037261 [Ensete ventricosum]|nr:hypothetical protein BHM03_00037261 [Ensete ventricosum]